LFTVISGSIEISQANERKQLHTGMSMIVRGESPHSVWNIGTDTAKVMGISISRNSI
jgi:mannose-6-phosphate isomerase-like protein (cupin superfamily)